MKILGIAAFTEPGRALGRDLAGQLENSWQIIWYESNLKDWCRGTVCGCQRHPFHQCLRDCSAHDCPVSAEQDKRSGGTGDG